MKEINTQNLKNNTSNKLSFINKNLSDQENLDITIDILITAVNTITKITDNISKRLDAYERKKDI